MFPFWMNLCCPSGSTTQKSYRQRQLEFLKWMRDSLETRLAAVNAAIATIEHQISTDNVPNPNP
jgi:hypothetical protein